MEIDVFDVKPVPRRQKGTVENRDLFHGHRLKKLSVGHVDSVSGGSAAEAWGAFVTFRRKRNLLFDLSNT